MHRNHSSLRAALLAASLLAATAATADHPQMEATAGYYKVFLGIVPAAHLMHYPDLVPHDHPIRSGRDLYHVELAIYDQRSGLRVEDAEVAAAVHALGTGVTRRTLRRMQMAGSITYCNYFRLAPGDRHTFDVSLRRAGWQSPLQVRLDYGTVSRR